jgi:hypothetical protein
MSNDRSKMDLSLKLIVIPFLKDLGFTGFFPHFRRIREKGIDLITFQFDKLGGGFVIEISHCPSEGITTRRGENISPDKVKAWDVDSQIRIKPKKGFGTDSWFRYDRKNLIGNIYNRISRKVVVLLKEKAVPYWSEYS